MIFLVLLGKMIFFFSKIRSDTLDRKWKIIFLKKYTEIWYFLQAPEKMAFPNRTAPAHDLSCIIWRDGIFFPKTLSFFPGQKLKNCLSQEIHENTMHRPAKKNLIYRSEVSPLLKFIRLEIFYNNNPQCFVPFSPQHLCLRVC